MDNAADYTFLIENLRNKSEKINRNSAYLFILSLFFIYNCLFLLFSPFHILSIILMLLSIVGMFYIFQKRNLIIESYNNDLKQKDNQNLIIKYIESVESEFKEIMNNSEEYTITGKFTRKKYNVREHLEESGKIKESFIANFEKSEINRLFFHENIERLFKLDSIVQDIKGISPKTQNNHLDYLKNSSD